jgi:hypothetical protein
MLYIMRLIHGDCIIASARDERSALDLADRLANEDGETVVSVRELPRFALRLSPNDEASMEVHSWEDSTLDDVLINEYPALNDAFRAANAVPFMPRAQVDEPLFAQLSEAHEQNTEIIRKGLRREQQRFGPEPALKARKAAHK